MNSVRTAFFLMLMLPLLLVGCVTIEPQVEQGLTQSTAPAFALDGASDEFRFAVSPAGDTLSMIPRVGRVIGTSVDAMVNDRIRVAFREALGEYDPGTVVLAEVERGLDEFVEPPPAMVSPLSTTAGFNTVRDAEAARRERLSKQGYDLLFDIETQYGLYDSDVRLRVKLGGRTVTLPEGDVLWRDELELTAGPLLADLSFQNVLQRVVPYLNVPELTAEGDALDALRADDAQALKDNFEKTVDAAVAGMLDSMEVQRTAAGQHALGRSAFWAQNWDEAVQHLAAAHELAPEDVAIAADHGAALARTDALDEAITVTEAALVQAPDYGPAHYNLAYWLAVEREDPEAARPHYEAALEAGMPISRRIDRALGIERE